MSPQPEDEDSTFVPPPELVHGAYRRTDPHWLKEGSFGVVAKYEHMGRIEAVKFLTYGRNEMVPAEEILLAAGMEHENLVVVHYMLDSDRERSLPHGTWAMIMEFVDGGSLQEEVDAVQGRGLPEETLRLWAIQMTSALAYLHSKDVVHGDLHLDNVLVKTRRYRNADGAVEESRSIKIVDLGHSVRVGLPARGKPSVRAPEAFVGTVPQSDFWSVGLILTQLLSGRLLTPTGKPDEMRDQALAAVAGRPESPVKAVIAELLQERPEDRPDRAAVRRLLSGENVPPRRREPRDHRKHVAGTPPVSSLDRRRRFAGGRGRISDIRAILGRRPSPRLRRRSMRALLAISTALALGTLGWFAAGGLGTTAPDGLHRLVSGPLEVSYAAPWRPEPVAPSSLHRVLIEPFKVLVDHRFRGATFAIGAIHTSRSILDPLPTTVKRALDVAGPPKAVVIGSLSGISYTARPGGGQMVSLLVTATSKGDLGVICTATKSDFDRFEAACIALAGRVQLTGARAEQPQLNSEYSSELLRLLDHAETVRHDEMTGLTAGSLSRVAQAATAIARAYSTAEGNLRSFPVRQQDRGSAQLIAAACGVIALAFEKLAHAARSQSRAAFASAVVAARHGDTSLRRALGLLRAEGYAVSIRRES